MRRGDSDYDKIIKVGCFADSDYYEWEYRVEFFRGSDDLVFQFYDPNDPKKSNLGLDAVFLKLSDLTTYYKVSHSSGDFPKFARNIEKNIKKLSLQSGKKLFLINQIKDQDIFLNRKSSRKFLDTLLSQPHFQQQLAKREIVLTQPKSICISLKQYNNTPEMILRAELKYPLLVKSQAAVSLLHKRCHEFILIKNEKALEKVFKEDLFQVRELFPIIVQELIEEVDCCEKYYCSFRIEIL